MQLRNSAEKGDLKQLSIEEIRNKIREFYLVTINGDTKGCFRIFVPPTIPYVLELGSVRSGLKGIGSEIASYSENLAKEKQKQIVTIVGKKYQKTIEKHDWRLATRWFPERMAETDSRKELWIYQKL